MPASTMPTKIGDFYILQISLPPLPSFQQSATHYLYVRPHEPKNPDSATPRSLFLVNIPIDTTEAHLKHLLSVQLGLPAGRIEDVQFESDRKKSRASEGPQIPHLPPRKIAKKRKRDAVEETIPELEGVLPETWDREVHLSGSNAVVVFIDRASMEATMKAVNRAHKLSSPVVWGKGLAEKSPALGSKRYLAHGELVYPPQATLLASVNKYMTAYATREVARAQALKRQRQEPDEDGFVTVTRGGRTGAARHEESSEKLEQQKQKQKGFEDFYRFQSREKRKERAGELVKKFEEDREKVRKMKEQRGRFRPE